MSSLPTSGWKGWPRQFWILLVGGLVSATGGAMIWPFMTIFLRQRLNVPLTSIALLFTLNAVMGILASFLAGTAADQLGRKRIMLMSLAAGVVYYVLMSQAGAFWHYALLMAGWGAFNPLYNVGANAMVADMIVPERRTEAYAIVRMVHNVGVAVGPVAGGFIAAISYNTAFLTAALAFSFFVVLTAFFIRETLPVVASKPLKRGPLSGYEVVLKDQRFLQISLLFSVTMMSASIMFIMFSTYAKAQFNMAEDISSWVITTNALMCIFVQYSATLVTRRFRALPVLAVGALFYAFGVGSVALGRGFWAFVISMAVLTIGELVMTPTATTLVANMAPVDMRGRYMSIYGLAWPIASGVGPFLAGMLNDHVSPVSMWYGGLLLGLLAAAGFFVMAQRTIALDGRDSGSLERKNTYSL